jgi:hypothetical protein
MAGWGVTKKEYIMEYIDNFCIHQNSKGFYLLGPFRIVDKGSIIDKTATKHSVVVVKTITDKKGNKVDIVKLTPHTCKSYKPNSIGCECVECGEKILHSFTTIGVVKENDDVHKIVNKCKVCGYIKEMYCYHNYNTDIAVCSVCGYERKVEFPPYEKLKEEYSNYLLYRSTCDMRLRKWKQHDRFSNKESFLLSFIPFVSEIKWGVKVEKISINNNNIEVLLLIDTDKVRMNEDDLKEKLDSIHSFTFVEKKSEYSPGDLDDKWGYFGESGYTYLYYKYTMKGKKRILNILNNIEKINNSLLNKIGELSKKRDELLFKFKTLWDFYKKYRNTEAEEIEEFWEKVKNKIK